MDEEDLQERYNDGFEEGRGSNSGGVLGLFSMRSHELGEKAFSKGYKHGENAALGSLGYEHGEDDALPSKEEFKEEVPFDQVVYHGSGDEED